ncbi:MAG: hypothetical protein N2235_23805 [Fischerella sp.]|nr:hypothetical protein [Fischerella sp.]
MNFGKYSILTNKRHYLRDESNWWWEFKPITSADELRIVQFWNDGKDHTWVEAMWLELALSFGGTNIPADESKPVEEGGEPYILPSDNIDVRIEKLKEMPSRLVRELWDELGKVVQGWGPRKED